MYQIIYISIFQADDPKIAKLDQAVAKESFSALMTVILEAARTDTDATSLRLRIHV